MLDALDLRNGKLFTADEISTFLAVDDLNAQFICPECHCDVGHVKASSKHVSYFFHKTEFRTSHSCSRRMKEDSRSTRATKAFDKSFADEKEMYGLIQAINGDALRRLCEFRHYFGGERTFYLKVKESSERIISDVEDDWVRYIQQMFKQRHDLSGSAISINEVFLNFLVSKAKTRPKLKKYIETEFHQVFWVAVSAAYSLIELASKNYPDCSELKKLKHTFDTFKFDSPDSEELERCQQIFAANLGSVNPKNYSQLAVMLIAERFTQIVLEMDIRGFLMNPEKFIDKKSLNGIVPGYVYVLICPKHAVSEHPLNLSKNEIIKIGQTKRVPSDRAGDLSQGLAWETFEVFGFVYTEARLTLEKFVKSELRLHLVAKEEFFDCEPKYALWLIQNRKRDAEEEGDPVGDKRNRIDQKQLRNSNL